MEGGGAGAVRVEEGARGAGEVVKKMRTDQQLVLLQGTQEEQVVAQQMLILGVNLDKKACTTIDMPVIINSSVEYARRPHPEAVCWTGCFLVSGGENINLGEFKAYHPSTVSSKVRNITKKMPNNLHLEIQPRMNYWPKAFEKTYPVYGDIAMDRRRELLMGFFVKPMPDSNSTQFGSVATCPLDFLRHDSLHHCKAVNSDLVVLLDCTPGGRSDLQGNNDVCSGSEVEQFVNLCQSDGILVSIVAILVGVCTVCVFFLYRFAVAKFTTG